MKCGRPVCAAAGAGVLAGVLAFASSAQPLPEGVGEPAPLAAESSASSVFDPWEAMNRRTFAFNEFIDRYFLELVATGWNFVVPEPAQRGIANAFANLATPRRLANDLLQAKPREAGHDLGRFVINTTFGLGGLLDLAGAQGLPPGDEDFGLTLGVWGVPAGPYLVLPLLGPSSPRDTAGLAVDTALTPELYFAPWYVSYPMTSTRVVNARSLALETVRAERQSAFDFYAAVRSAYVQYRTHRLRGGANEPEGQDTNEQLYNVDEEKD